MIDKIKDSAKSGNPEDIVILYGFSSRQGTASSASPFVGKIELYLRMNDIPYEIDLDFQFKGPKQKVPYIKHGNNIVSDSTFIIEYLKETYKDKLKMNEIDPTRKAIASAARIMAEEHIYFALMTLVYMTKESWQEQKKYLKQLLPSIFSFFIIPQLHKKIQNILFAQGMGRHSKNDIMTLLKKDYKVLSNILSEYEYFGGSEICEDDAALFFYIDVILSGNAAVDSNEIIGKYPNLIAYHTRIKEAYFPEENPSKFSSNPSCSCCKPE